MDNKNKLEKTLAFHCAPTFVGIKPSNLVSCYKKHYHNIPELINFYNSIFNYKGIFLDVLLESDSYYLLMVYNKKSLKKHLNKSSSINFLEHYGYDLTLPIEEILNRLKYNFHISNNFPHEIGVFLGYPIDDVIGFIENKGANYKLCGYWKVYSDEEKSKKLFDSYTKYRKIFYSNIVLGHDLSSLI